MIEETKRINVHLSLDDKRQLRELRTLLERKEDRTVTFSEVVRLALRRLAESENALA